MPTLLLSNKGLRLLGIAVSLGALLSLSGCAAVVIGAVGASAVTSIRELSKCSLIFFLLGLIPLTQNKLKFFILSAKISIDCRTL